MWADSPNWFAVEKQTSARGPAVQTRLATRLIFCPPKPKLFVST